MMNPDAFLTQEDVPLLIQAFTSLAREISAAADRKDMLINAGVHTALCNKLTFEISPFLFANKLIAHLREYRVSTKQLAYHPLVSMLEYLLAVQDLEEQDRDIFERLLKRGHENFNGQRAQSAVGRIESPPGVAIGTGVLVDSQLILTCQHVLKRIFDKGLEQAWIRFGYKQGRYSVDSGEILELDMKYTADSNPHTLDYALVKVVGKPARHAVPLSSDWLNLDQEIRLIHHPRGEPVQISDIGRVVQLDQEYIRHNVPTDYGSSGGAVFDTNWHLVAIHRGTLSLSRPAPPGITEAIPMYSIWDEIKPHLVQATT